jgi:HJR/Mrr/RecB family endonuclease
MSHFLLSKYIVSFGWSMKQHYFGAFDRCLHFDPRIAPEVWLVNGNEVRIKKFEEFLKVIKIDRPCPYCSNYLQKVFFQGAATKAKPKISDNVSRNSEELNICDSCGFWRAGYKETRGMMRGMCFSYAAAVQRVFPIDVPDAPLKELFEYLKRNPELITQINPRVFERIVGECFRANWRPVDTIYVGGPYDGGIDVVLVLSDDSRWLIQCKRRSKSNAVESIRAVRELLGTLRAEDELRGIVVSTADHFSYYAQKLAIRPNLIDVGYEIKLVDYGILKEMLVGAQFGPEVQTNVEGDKIEVVADGPWISFFNGSWV